MSNSNYKYQDVDFTELFDTINSDTINSNNYSNLPNFVGNTTDETALYKPNESTDIKYFENGQSIIDAIKPKVRNVKINNSTNDTVDIPTWANAIKVKVYTTIGEKGISGDRGDTGETSTTSGSTGPSGYTGATGLKGDTGDPGPTGTPQGNWPGGFGGPGGEGGDGGDGGYGGDGGQGGDGGYGGDGGDGGSGALIGTTDVYVFRANNNTDNFTINRTLSSSESSVSLRNSSTAIEIFNISSTKGFSGNKGFKGFKGFKGGGGATGGRGGQGGQGYKGGKGGPGPRGLDPTAYDNMHVTYPAPGPKGVKGAMGVKGATGTKGAKGVKGTTGTKGAIGAKGAKGSSGLKGSVSYKGLLPEQLTITQTTSTDAGIEIYFFKIDDSVNIM